MRDPNVLRNRIAWRLANAALSLATSDYRKFIGGAIRYGMVAAANERVILIGHEKLADAWDDGYAASCRDEGAAYPDGYDEPPTWNPYRAEAS